MSSFKFQKHVLASSIAMVFAGVSTTAISAEEAVVETDVEVIECDTEKVRLLSIYQNGRRCDAGINFTL